MEELKCVFVGIGRIVGLIIGISFLVNVLFFPAMAVIVTNNLSWLLLYLPHFLIFAYWVGSD